MASRFVYWTNVSTDLGFEHAGGRFEEGVVLHRYALRTGGEAR